MSHQKKDQNGWGCSNIPFSIIIAILGGGYWWFIYKQNLDLSKLLPTIQRITIPLLNPTLSTSPTPTSSSSSTSDLDSNNQQTSFKTKTPPKILLPQTPWEKKVIRGIYLSRYQVTNKE